MKYVPARDFGEALCRLCGLDPESVLELSVIARPGELPDITARTVVRTEDGKVSVVDDEIQEITRRYVLVDVVDMP